MRKVIGSCNHIVQLDLREFKGRVFFVSDLHGHYDLLHEALADVGFNARTDILISGGDWTDRGPDSQHVLDYVNEPWVYSVRGNHEQMFIEGFESHWHPNNRSVLTLKAHGGQWIWGLDDLTKILIHEAFSAMPLGIELLLPHGRKVGVVHAEVPFYDWDGFKAITRAELEWNGQAVAQWSRTWYDKLLTRQVNGVDFVLVGHTPTDSAGDVERHGNMVFTDGGSFFRDKINLIELNDEFMRRMK